ncbi:MAG: hypothetical protein LBG80_05665 [Bacteroidales bacterium]|jgi:hypothetical protein|nr:hypothetical protein [Bacteroidales bacterium]
MSKPQKESFFWTSYSDLMTSLFFVMLVLFILVIVLLHNKMREIEKEREASQEQLDKIREIEASVKNIDSTYFVYDSTYKRHTLRDIHVSFHSESADITDIPLGDRRRLLDVGKSILTFVNDAVSKNPNVKYLLIIEGQSSISNYNNPDECRNNDVLSYRRALSLIRYWNDNNKIFNPDICEVIISGSGTSSPFKEPEYLPSGKVNYANQRFVIHIIPKPGTIK